MTAAIQSVEFSAPGGRASRRRWLVGLAAAAVLWFDPSSGVAKAVLWTAGLYALWNWRRTWAAWKNPAGVLLALGTAWAVVSVAWSIEPSGSARDLLKSAPMALAALAAPVVFDRPGRVWAALVASAGMITLRLTVDMVRLLAELGWPAVMAQARFCHPYLYTHPNVTSMMAGLCVFVFAARWLAGAPGMGCKLALASGLALDLAYLAMMGSRGPQAVFALVELGWPAVMAQARFCHPYLYTHPNVTSMMAGLCVFVFAARWLAGAPGMGCKLALASGLALDLAYLAMMGSRGPQAVFALVALVFPVASLPGWRTRAAAALVVTALGAGLWQTADRINPRFRDRTMENFTFRDKVWRHAGKLANRHPVVGNGFGKRAFVKALYDNPEHQPPRIWFRFPHAHSYWLMLYFQGGTVGLALWSLGWAALAVRLGRGMARARQGVAPWGERLRAPLLPLLLGSGMAFILIYGIADYPDSVIRQALFYLAGLAMVPIPAPATASAP